MSKKYNTSVSLTPEITLINDSRRKNESLSTAISRIIARYLDIIHVDAPDLSSRELRAVRNALPVRITLRDVTALDQHLIDISEHKLAEFIAELTIAERYAIIEKLNK